MSDNADAARPSGARPLGARLAVSGALLLAASAYFGWAAYSNAERGYAAYAILLLVTAAGVLQRHVWGQYFVFAYVLATILLWLFEAAHAVWALAADASRLSLVISLVPGLAWCAFLLSLSWNVRRGYQAPAPA